MILAGAAADNLCQYLLALSAVCVQTNRNRGLGDQPLLLWRCGRKQIGRAGIEGKDYSVRSSRLNSQKQIAHHIWSLASSNMAINVK